MDVLLILQQLRECLIKKSCRNLFLKYFALACNQLHLVSCFNLMPNLEKILIYNSHSPCLLFPFFSSQPMEQVGLMRKKSHFLPGKTKASWKKDSVLEGLIMQQWRRGYSGQSRPCMQIEGGKKCGAFFCLLGGFKVLWKWDQANITSQLGGLGGHREA